MKYRLLIGELLFTIGSMSLIFTLAYRWSNSLIVALGLTAGTFWIAVLVSWLLQRSAIKELK